MRMLKKVMTGMSIAAAALVVAGGVNATDAAAQGSASFEADTQTMTAKGSNTEVMVSFDAIKVSTKTGLTWNAKAKWDVYDGDKATVDLSALKPAKDMYIAVKDNTADLPVVYHIAPETTKLAGKYEVADKKSKLTFTNNKAALDSAVKLEYKTQNAAGWTSYDASKFDDAMKMYEQQGATLYFRKKAVDLLPAAKKVSDDGYYELSEVSGSFATTEVKVKVTKMANAPTATFDYDNGIIKAKKGTEYRFLSNSGKMTKDGEFTATPEDGKVAIADITESGVFEVRTAADKKVASKIGIYAYTGVAAPKSSDVSVVASDEAVGSGLNLVYGKDKKGNDQVTFYNGNAASNTYIVYKEDPRENAKAKAIATVKSAAANKDKLVGVTVAKSKLADGDALFIVTASDKKAGVFRSPVLSGITVKYPVE